MRLRTYRLAMDFQVLGPLRAVADGVDIEVRGAKERTLLMHLVASAGQSMSRAAVSIGSAEDVMRVASSSR